MKRSSLFLVGWLSTLACSKAQSDAPPAPPSPTPVAPAPPSTAPSPAASPPAAAQQERPLLPPAEVGKANVQMLGCLADPHRSEQPPATRGPAPPESLVVSATPAGVSVRHELAHNCCAEASIESRVVGARVEVVEKLEGKVCRCMCSSTLRTAIRLSPGEYTVVVVLSQDGQERSVGEQTVRVSSLSN